uniref:Uncharacterized protein n=1 Tax=Oryza nivara TaxID=4536 RepID=A0A0E0HLL5_ORYNI
MEFRDCQPPHDMIAKIRGFKLKKKPEYSSPLADADTSFTFLVIGCNGRSVSVGESKLLHRCWPSGSMTIRFPLLRSSARSARVAVVLSRRAKVPSFWKVSLEPFPFTGASRFAVQATVFSDDLENQMEKNPQEKSPLGDTRMVVVSSWVEMDERLAMKAWVEMDERLARKGSRQQAAGSSSREHEKEITVAKMQKRLMSTTPNGPDIIPHLDQPIAPLSPYCRRNESAVNHSSSSWRRRSRGRWCPGVAGGGAERPRARLCAAAAGERAARILLPGGGGTARRGEPFAMIKISKVSDKYTYDEYYYSLHFTIQQNPAAMIDPH